MEMKVHCSYELSGLYLVARAETHAKAEASTRGSQPGVNVRGTSERGTWKAVASTRGPEKSPGDYVGPTMPTNQRNGARSKSRDPEDANQRNGACPRGGRDPDAELGCLDLQQNGVCARGSHDPEAVSEHSMPTQTDHVVTGVPGTDAARSSVVRENAPENGSRPTTAGRPPTRQREEQAPRAGARPTTSGGSPRQRRQPRKDGTTTRPREEQAPRAGAHPTTAGGSPRQRRQPREDDTTTADGSPRWERSPPAATVHPLTTSGARAEGPSVSPGPVPARTAPRGQTSSGGHPAIPRRPAPIPSQPERRKFRAAPGALGRGEGRQFHSRSSRTPVENGWHSSASPTDGNGAATPAEETTTPSRH